MEELIIEFLKTHQYIPMIGICIIFFGMICQIFYKIIITIKYEKRASIFRKDIKIGDVVDYNNHSSIIYNMNGDDVIITIKTKKSNIYPISKYTIK